MVRSVFIKLAIICVVCLSVQLPKPGFAQSAKKLVQTCTGENSKQAIIACTKLISGAAKYLKTQDDLARAYYYRGKSHFNEDDYDNSISDLTEAIRLQPSDDTFYITYISRSLAYTFKSNIEQAVQDANTAIQLNPKQADGYVTRGMAYHIGRQYEKALADYNNAILIKPDYNSTYIARASVFMNLGHFNNALTDADTGLKLDPKDEDLIRLRGIILCEMGHLNDAIAWLNKAIEADPGAESSYYFRGKAWELKGDITQAKKDYYALLAIPEKKNASRLFPIIDIYQDARSRIAKLEGQQNQTVVTNQQAPVNLQKNLQTTQVSSSANDRKIALVIGNSSYSDAGRLANPSRDASAIAASFRRLGFAEVIELHDLDYSAFKKALKDFGDKASTADWAVIYYAGHGIQVSNTNYLIPTDAKLVSASHVEDEAIPLNHLLSKVNDAKKMRLVILDSCRDNPFSKKMMADSKGTRSVSRGLALVEPDSGTLVAYAARDGQVANDGETGQNSPYTQALLQHLEEPGLDIGLLFRKVRDSVMTSTGKKQEPFTYGSLPGVTLSFK